MQAPIVELVALIEHASRAQLIGKRVVRIGMPPTAKFAVRIGLRRDSRGIKIVAFGDAKDDVPVAEAAYTAANAEFFGPAVTGWGAPGGAAPKYVTARDHPLIERQPRR